ncbi:MAG: hypothetical protein JNL87_13830 [Burkholderiaceae bacterium]|nr:hypothetical protein [Burkholderiaceae bacterium]
MTRKTLSLATLAIAAFTLTAAQAQAATIRVQCEQRSDRSIVSVDGKNIARGNYSASINSGGNIATTPTRAAVNGEAEFDFSSQPNDVAAGAVAIPLGFVVGATVSGRVVDAAGNTVAVDTVACRVRR